MIHGQINAAGLWLEFEPYALPGRSSQPSPLMWFQFWTGIELRALRNHHHNYVASPAHHCISAGCMEPGRC